jgi:hypothetical protein
MDPRLNTRNEFRVWITDFVQDSSECSERLCESTLIA